MKKCLNCGRYNDYFLCESCREEQILSNIYNQIRSYDPENCENTYLIEYASTLTEKYQERDIIPEILSLFPFAVAEYYYCMYYVMRRDDRFEEAAIAYLYSHDDKEEKSHRILYSLLKSYIRNDYIKPQKWCEYILDRDYLPCDLYPLAAEYYGMIGEYDRAELLLKRAKSLCCSGNECRLLYSSAESMTTKIDKQLEDVHRYRTKKPYWPTSEDKRRVVAKFYDKKGIIYPRIESKPQKVSQSQFKPLKKFTGQKPHNYCSFWLSAIEILPGVYSLFQISAVKVRDDQIIDEYQKLARPLSSDMKFYTEQHNWGFHISADELQLANDVDIVMKDFMSFVGDDVLISTDINNYQGKILIRAARYSGFTEIENEIIDIYELSKYSTFNVSMYRNLISNDALSNADLLDDEDGIGKAIANVKMMNNLNEMTEDYPRNSDCNLTINDLETKSDIENYIDTNDESLSFEDRVALAIANISKKCDLDASIQENLPSRCQDNNATKKNLSACTKHFDGKHLLAPDFDSFVAFDIETSGTYGISNGDGPAEITEIGAVKVINGEIVEHFSELVNPGRLITPMVSSLTKITNFMVADKPPVEVVIRKFKEFVGDNILVGHNIISFDMPYIYRAGEKAGITFENEIFDTYRFAKTLQRKKCWTTVKLGYLADQFGIKMSDAHRAWCDAEANVGVFFALKSIN